MSFMLPDVSLANAAVGNTGKIPLQNMGISAGGVSANPAFRNKPATLYFHNDSGCGLGMTLKDSGNQFNLPAGAWVPVPIGPGESEVDYVVKYVLPNPPVSTLMIAYYGPGEPIPQTSTLGNSPVGIGGSVQTSSIQTLSNEGNAANTLVIDIGDAAISQLWKIYTDHFAISVDQSGTAHTALKGNTSGNPLQLGQSGDITEILGELQLDAQVVSPSASPITFNAPSGQQIQFLQNGTTIFFMDNTGIHLFGNFAYDLGSVGLFKFRNGNTTQAWGNFTGTGSGTYNHGFGSAPFAVIPIVDVVGSATQGYDSITSTQVHITLGASLGFRATMWS